MPDEALCRADQNYINRDYFVCQRYIVMRNATIVVLAATLMNGNTLTSKARSEEVPVEYRPSITRGLEWLVQNQHKEGCWSANGGTFRVTMTAVSGMALLMEGSTIREGKYSVPIRRAVDW